MAATLIDRILQKGTQEDVKYMNKMYYAILLLHWIGIQYMVDINDELSRLNIFSFGIKKDWMDRYKKIADECEDIFSFANKEEREAASIDAVELKKYTDVFFEIIENKFLIIANREEPENYEYTIRIDPVGNLHLQHESGWVVDIPNIIAKSILPGMVYENVMKSNGCKADFGFNVRIKGIGDN